MIYLISDLHGEHDFKGLNDYMRLGGENDLLIILGDVMMRFDDSEKNHAFTEYMLSIQKPIAMLDGNHENYAFLNSFPEQDWNGGRVHRLSEHMVHLMRGYVFDIQGVSMLTLGGCKSSPGWKARGEWYEGEEPTEQEYARTYDSFLARGCCVDYILTHKFEPLPPAGLVTQGLLELTSFVEEKVQYKRWYCGHGHQRLRLDDKHIMVYDELTALE